MAAQTMHVTYPPDREGEPPGRSQIHYCPSCVRGYDRPDVRDLMRVREEAGGYTHRLAPTEHNLPADVMAWNDHTIPRLIQAGASPGEIADALEDAGHDDAQMINDLRWRRR